MQSFPKPMDAKEEEECIKRYQAGDKSARQLLIEKNLRLVAYIVKKYNTSDRELDDLLSIGTIGLIKGVDSFDGSKKIRLATYCARCIENEILMYIRTEKKSSKNVYLYDSIGSDKEGNEISLIDVIEYEDEDVVEKLTQDERIRRLNNKIEDVLNSREKDIIRKRYGIEGYDIRTQREIAAEYGISRSYISRIEKSALFKLRKSYENDCL
ncbi:RNA polymerase sporulation sigma factor SigK [Eubacterium sp. MSJ-13]|uniref:RNA polymerase sporulation sigma factor SigK n=1 Tax=Eubacterium sp. MSJ-13 TaxID=2841513 RepID=UPI001C1178EC|nr:RNA polymerase sporulation sigma factor SigK [Eubacterium sp. MSJ-13]